MLVRRFRWVGVALLVALSLGLTGFWYLSARRARLDDANRRELARVAHDLESVLKSLSSSAESYFRGQPTGGVVVQGALVSGFAQRSPYVLGIDGSADWDGMTKLCPSLPNPTTLKLSGLKEPITLRVDTDKIFDDVPIGNSFEYLFISDIKGEVNIDMAHGEASHRDGLGWLDQLARASAERAHPYVKVANFTGLVDESTGKAIAPDALAQASGTRTVLLGANRYQLFSYPVALSSNCDPATTRWIVAGLVDPIRMWREAATLAPRSTLLLLLALLIPFFAEPAIKTLLLRSTERLRFADVCLMLPNTAMLMMLGTLLLLDVGTSDDLAAREQHDLSSLAEAVDNSLTNEFRQMRDQVAATDRLNFVWDEGKPDCSIRGSDRPNLLRGANQLNVKYKNLWLMFWVDPDGRQIYKMDVHRNPTPRTVLSARAYFQAVKDRPGYLWEFRDAPTTGPKFHVESVRSVNTGELTTILAIPSEASKTCERPGYVAAISGPPVAIEHPLLPGGSELAVIASDGQVLYHSDRRRTLKENFFEEVADPHAVRAAIVSGTELYLSTSYGRRPVDLFLRPFHGMKGPNWFVVTLRDNEWRETISAETLVRSTFLGVLSWLPLVILTLVALWRRDHVVGVIWPDSGRESAYRAVTLTCGALILTALAGMWVLSPTGLPQFALSMALPLVVVLATAAAGRYGQNRKSDATGRIGAPRWYLPAVATFFVAAALMPAAGLYRHSWHIEIGKLDRFEQKRAQQRGLDWAAEDRARYAEIDGTDDQMMRDRARGRMEFFVQYGDKFSPNWLDDFLDRQLPFYNETLESVRDQAPGEPGGPTSEARFTSIDQRGLGFSLVSLVLWLVAVLGIVWWLRLTIAGLFWTRTSAPAVPSNRLVILIAPSLQDKVRLREFFALPASRASAPHDRDGSPLVVDFEKALSRSDAGVTLEQLEQALAAGGAVLIAESDPLSHLTSAPAHLFASPTHRERWITVVVRGVHGAAVTDAGGSGGDAARQAYFHALWYQCDRNEQLTLMQMSEEEFTNPHSADTVERLLAKGLVVTGPLRPMSPEFLGFVLSQAAHSPDVKEWEYPEGAFGWHQARWVLLLLLVAGLALAWATGENWIKGATAFLTMLAGGLEAFQKAVTATERLRPAK